MTSGGLRGSPLSTSTNVGAWYLGSNLRLNPPFVIAAVTSSITGL